MAALGTGAAVKIKTELAHLFNNAHYAFDRMKSEDFTNAQKGDTIEVGTLAALTINTDGSTDQTAEDPSLSALSLVIDNEPMILVHLKRRLMDQMLGGGGKWAEEISADAMPEIANYRDRNLFDYLSWTTAYDTSATYWSNVAGDTLTYVDFLTAKAKLLSQRSSDINRLQFWIDGYAEAAVHNFSGFVPTNQALEDGQFGVRSVGSISGIPVFVSAELPGTDARGAVTVASTAYANVSNVQTITVGTGHGLVPGMKVSFDTVTAGGDVSTAVAISSVTATTVVIANAGADSNATEAGTITLAGTVNMLIDAGHVHTAQEGATQVHIVKREKSTGHNLQVSPLFGRTARAGRVVGIVSPRLSL